eukprot:scaffold119262_cov20-Tisochrysis_lutea.AAC.3
MAVSGRRCPGRQGYTQVRQLLPSNSLVHACPALPPQPLIRVHTCMHAPMYIIASHHLPLPLPARWSDPDPLKAAFPFADVVASKGGAGITGGVLLAFLDFPELLGLQQKRKEV